jgi:hypothetical protein
MTRGSFYAAGFVIFLLATAGNAYIGLRDHGRLNHDEQETCEIQGRGLEGQHHLTAIMADVAQLLTPIPNSPPTTPTLVVPLANLREQVGAYLTIEREQPPSRTC